jgi:uncharacterized protein (UPF0335 family)
MDIGDNAGAVLKAGIEEIVELEKQILDHKEFRKSKTDEMKKLGLPVADLIRIAKQDTEKAQEKASRAELAAGILGATVYTGEATPDAPGGWDPDIIEAGKDGAAAVLKIDEDIKAAKDQIKEKVKSLKNDGFVPKVVYQIVELKMNPDGYAAFSEHSQLVDVYWKACS